MTFRYQKRAWDESRGDPFDSWGPSLWYFEVGEDGYPVRQLERYADGTVLEYSALHVEDFYGGLGDQPIGREDLAAFEITQDELEAAWEESVVIGKHADDARPGAIDGPPDRGIARAGHEVRGLVGDRAAHQRHGEDARGELMSATSARARDREAIGPIVDRAATEPRVDLRRPR